MTFPQPPAKGQPVRAELIRQIIDCLRMFRPIAGQNIRTQTTPGGTIIDGTPGGGEADRSLKPWTVRFHRTEDDEDGKWEIWLPTGCMSCGGTLAPLNKPMQDVDGHGETESGWYLLAIDEEDGDPTRTEEAEGEDGSTVTTAVREFEIVAHAKTSAKVEGVDELDAPARRMLYVSARKRLGSGETRTDEEEVADTWGDEFSQTVAVVAVRDAGGGGTSRRVTQAASAPISVAGRVRANFDLVWYFSTGDDGKLSVSKVYCVRNGTAVAGITAEGPTMVEVTDAESAVYARIDTNAGAGNAITGENVVSVVVDPAPTAADQYVTWLRLYDMSHNAVLADYRASSLVNVQVFR